MSRRGVAALISRAVFILSCVRLYSGYLRRPTPPRRAASLRDNAGKLLPPTMPGMLRRCHGIIYKENYYIIIQSVFGKLYLQFVNKCYCLKEGQDKDANYFMIHERQDKTHRSDNLRNI